MKPIIIPGHTSNVSAVAISPDKRWLVTGSFDGTAHIWTLGADGPTGGPRVFQASEKVPAARTELFFKW